MKRVVLFLTTLMLLVAAWNCSNGGSQGQSQYQPAPQDTNSNTDTDEEENPNHSLL